MGSMAKKWPHTSIRRNKTRLLFISEKPGTGKRLNAPNNYYAEPMLLKFEVYGSGDFVSSLKSSALVIMGNCFIFALAYCYSERMKIFFFTIIPFI
jgi:hypothetical protein